MSGLLRSKQGRKVWDGRRLRRVALSFSVAAGDRLPAPSHVLNSQTLEVTGAAALQLPPEKQSRHIRVRLRNPTWMKASEGP